MDRLPYEINLIIFTMLLFSNGAPTDYHQFYNLRAKIMSTYSGWFRFFTDENRFWPFIIVKNTSAPRAAPSYIRRSGNIPLHMQFIFDSFSRNATKADIVKIMDDRVTPLKPHFVRAVEIHIQSRNETAMEHFHHLFKRTYAPLLKRLSVTYSLALGTGEHRGNVDTENRRAKIWFGGKLEALEELLLETTNMQFHRMNIPMLKKIQMKSWLDLIHVREHTIRTLTEQCKELEELHLCGTSVLGWIGENGKIRSTSIKTLGLGFAHNGTTRWVTDCFEFPNLTTVQLHLKNNRDMMAATECSEGFKQATTMRIRWHHTWHNIQFHSTELFERSSQIETLDLRYCPGNMFRKLLENSEEREVDGRPRILPQLKIINLPAAIPAFITRFIKIHAELTTVTIRSSRYYGPFTESMQADMNWIAGSIENFTLETSDSTAYKITEAAYILIEN
ncbi:hypothetical protein B0H11DRAFT_1915252 [Mycena galericulata]|nr:hypothetical protein B0H11DRAFT_1915252 [Mycena galericulata]